MKTCPTCGHRGDDVGVACYFCLGGNSAEFSRLGHSLLRALGRKPPAIDKEAKEAVKATKAADARAKVYPAKPEDLGLTTPQEVFSALVSSDAFSDVESQAGRRKLYLALAIVRGGAFKHEPPFTFCVQDVPDLQAIIAAYAPAQMARAIVAASRDGFYASKKTITFRELAQKMPALLAAPASRTGTASKERRAELMDATTAAIEALDAFDPMTAAEYRELDRSRMDVGTLDDMLRKVTADVAKWGKT